MLIIPALLASLTAVPACVPASGDAQVLLRRAADVTGLTSANGRVFRAHATDVLSHDYESDRMYAPFLIQTTRFDEWFEPATGADRVTTRESAIAGNEFAGVTTVGGRTASFSVRDTVLTPSAELHTQLQTTRPLNVWSVLADWIAAGDARVVERCEYRDFSRLVLVHPSSRGSERLYIDPASGYPVAVHRTEHHYLWGTRAVEYVYSNWTKVGDAHLPGAAFRMVDGNAEYSRSFGAMRLIPRDSAPVLALPATTVPMTTTVAAFLTPSAPDTVRVGPATFLLRNPGYQETVSLVGDTVYIFDATQGDERARQDSVWIGKLFPGRHPVVLVVTDLAWPHVAGVRYWVAQGATIVSHRSSRAFLEQVVNRKWLEQPDVLEQRRSRVKRMRFVSVDESLHLAGGAITAFGINGPSSEGALAVFTSADRFLWASDYVQTLRQPTQYLEEVVAAVHRMKLEPLKLAAEHLPLVDWARALALVPTPP